MKGLRQQEHDVTPDSAVRDARIVMDVCMAHGVRHAVLSPGSRNAPLLIAAAARDELAKKVVADERTAAFVGLGIAATLGEPVMLACTSGTALLNYAPAVAEAYYRQIPLIVVSADRPGEWIDQDDSQTIRQAGALRNFVKDSYDIEAPDATLCDRLVNDAMITALTPPAGPVHINLRLPEPLGEITRLPVPAERVIRRMTPVAEFSRQQVMSLAKELRGKKIMLTAGFLLPDHKMRRALSEMEQLDCVCLMAESTSNYTSDRMPWSVDLALSELSGLDKRKTELLRPDVIISVGGALISRKLKEFLRRSGADHWGVGHFRTTVDCFRSLSLRIDADPARFLRTLASCLREIGNSHDTPSDYSRLWLSLRREALQREKSLIKSAPWCELKAFDIIAHHLDRRFNLHLSNGTSVRYAQLFDIEAHATFCNRGVSGIDGSTSTAIGSATAYSGPTLLITGDMSFAYDMGGMACGLAPEGMKIIVMENSGGAIFRFIGSTGNLPEDVREPYFCAPRNFPVEDVARAFCWEYAHAKSAEELNKILPAFLNSPHRALLEISIPPQTGAEILSNLINR